MSKLEIAGNDSTLMTRLQRFKSHLNSLNFRALSPEKGRRRNDSGFEKRMSVKLRHGEVTQSFLGRLLALQPHPLKNFRHGTGVVSLNRLSEHVLNLLSNLFDQGLHRNHLIGGFQIWRFGAQGVDFTHEFLKQEIERSSAGFLPTQSLLELGKVAFEARDFFAHVGLVREHRHETVEQIRFGGGELGTRFHLLLQFFLIIFKISGARASIWETCFSISESRFSKSL